MSELMKKTELQTNNFQDVIELIQTSRKQVFAKVNQALIELYWQIGEYVTKKVEQEQ